MKIVTAAEMREIDRLTTEKYGVPSLTLMENAGAAVAEFAQKHFEFESVCVVCGKGNNGGDGFVAARKLHEAGKKVSIIVLAKSASELRGDAAKMFKKLKLKPVWVGNLAGFAKAPVERALKAELILDAILGTGFKPPLKGLAYKAVELINACPGCVLAVDLPSGVDADSPELLDARLIVHADAIVSFTAPKPALISSQLTDGPIAVSSIGSPPKLIAAQSSLHQDVITAAEVQSLAIPRSRNSHKGTFGHVLVIGGSVGKSGAAAMAGMAALRAGAGLVTVACPKSVQPIVAAFAPELMTEPLEETSEGTISLLALARREQLFKGKTVVVLGPGLSQNSETAEFVRDFVSVCSTSLVLDADGLNAFAANPEELQPDQDDFSFRVITPHPGEMSRLLAIPTEFVQTGRAGTARRAAELTRACVVLKGHHSLIANPEGQIWVNPTGNPGMAKGGSGDVLSGIIAGLLAQIPAQSLTFGLSSYDPEAAKLKETQQNVSATQARKLASELNEKMKIKRRQAMHLVAAICVARAVYVHGLAGDIARDLYGENSMIATDIINCLGEAFDLCEQEAHSKFAYIQR